MKNLLSRSLLLGSLLLVPFTSLALTVTTNTVMETNCDGGNFPPLYIYGNQGYHLWDKIDMSAAGIISTTSKVSVYTRNSAINIPNGWVQISNYMPSAGAYYAIWNNQLTTLNLSSLVPADANQPIAQVVYRIINMMKGVNNSYTYNFDSQYASFSNGTTPSVVAVGVVSDMFDPATTEAFNECHPIYARWCGDGVVSNGETCDDGAQNGQPGKCNNTCSSTSSGTPMCSTAYSGTLTAPITQGYCNSGTVMNFTGTIVGNITNYTWQCAGSGSVNCSANYQTGSATQTGGLSVKKYVSTGTTLSNDAQTFSSALELPRGSMFNYIVVVANSGATAIASGAKVTDVLPTGVTISGSINASGWTCTTSGNTAFTCLYPNTIATGATLPQIVIPAYLDLTVPIGTPVKNVAAVCELSGATLDCTTVPGDCNPTDPNYNPVTNKCDPAVIHVVPSIDLSIKKYVKGDDVFAPILTNEDFNYNIVVQNNGAFNTGTTSDSTSGTTTVTDTLPSYITLRGTPSGNGWTCTGMTGGITFSCTTRAIVAPHNLFEVITVPVRATSAVFQPNGIINTATVSNPYDKYLANNSDSAAVNPPNPNGFDLMIHKYVNGDDEGIGAQSGNALTYTFVVENLGMLAVTGTTTVTDNDFPTGITLSGVTGSGWTCTNTSTGFSCNRSDSIVMGARFPDILVQARIVGQPGVYRNIACLSNPGDPNEGAVLNPILGLYKVNNCNPADVVITPSDRFDLMIKKRVGYGLDSSLRDRNTGRYGNEEQDALVVSQGGNMLYAYTVTNLGAVTATGTTVVEDTLPNDVTISGSVYAPSPWTCSITGNGNRSFRCTTTSTLSVGQSFADIRVNAVASTAIPAGVYTNIVTLSNSGDVNPINNTDPANIRVEIGPRCDSLSATVRNGGSPLTTTLTCGGRNLTGSLTYQYKIRCYEGDTTGTYSTSNTRTCTYGTANATFTPSCAIQDQNGIILTGSVLDNTTPAGQCSTTITTSGSTSGLYYTCMSSNTQMCAAFADANACQTANRGVPCTYTTYDSCNANRNICPTGPSNPYCGNGILEPGEQCDVGPNANRLGCDSNCRLSNDPVTIPGADPITNTYLYLPGLSRTVAFTTSAFSHDFDCNTTNNASSLSVIDPFTSSIRSFLPPANLLRCDANKYQVVIGENTRVFTEADSIIFHLKTKYDIPVSLSGARVCIYTTNATAVSGPSESNCYYMGADVVLGKGDYVKYQWADHLGTHIFTGTARGINDVLLYTGGSLRNFQGRLPSGQYIDGAVEVKLEAIRTPIQVRVSKNMVSNSAGGSVYLRRVSFATANEVVSGFIDSVSNGNFTSTTAIGTTSSSSVSSTNTTQTTSVSTNINDAVSNLSVITSRARIGNATIYSLGDFDTSGLSLSDYNDVYAIKGNLTINSELTLSGVKTVIVEDGNLFINKNILNDSRSSWAFIVRNGNIVIDEGVTSVAGVYMAIPGSTGQTGRIKTPMGVLDSQGKCTTNPTQTILKVYGSLYGNADHIIACHTYVRANAGYDTLTTGLIINYSSRAFTYPPPLLSRFLEQYNVNKVAVY